MTAPTTAAHVVIDMACGCSIAAVPAANGMHCGQVLSACARHLTFRFAAAVWFERTPLRVTVTTDDDAVARAKATAARMDAFERETGIDPT